MNITTFHALLFCFGLIISTACSQPEPPLSGDLLIKHATIADGSGSETFTGNILVENGLIKKVGDFSFSEDEINQIIDADGKVVSPGFIDTHSHGNPLETPRFNNFLAMGVTTITIGQDGSSPGMNDLSAWMDQVDEIGTGPNIVHLTGHNSLRRFVDAPRKSELDESYISNMQNILSDAISHGSFGLSTGLEYDHGRFADQYELNALGQVVAQNDGIVISHMRNEDDDAIEESVQELINQAEESGASVQASHIKIVYANNPDRADAVIAQMNEARKRDVTITGDVYPYTASFTGISIVFPDFALPPHNYSDVVENNRTELAEYLRTRIEGRNGPEATLFGTAPWAGMTLAEIADSLNKPFEDVLIDDIGPRGASAAYFVMNENVMKRFLSAPYIMVSSDGSPTMRHPRGYGSFPKIIRQFVQEQNLLSLEEAIYKMSGLPAETLGLSNPEKIEIPRGLIHEGFAADLLIFHPENIRDTATFEQPHQLAEGFEWVFVNGVPVIENGVINENRTSGIIRRK